MKKRNLFLSYIVVILFFTGCVSLKDVSVYKNEEISDDKAVVEVEIEVLDYASSIRKSKKYYDEHLDEFKEDDTFIKYKLEQMKKVDDKIKYDMSFHLTKSEDGTWSLDSISDVDRQKIHGLYEK